MLFSAPEKQFVQSQVPGLVYYKPTESQLSRHGDGGVAIIDQWIASHAKYFIGSKESTFSFRIREDRQLMGFSQDSTFNDLCGEGGKPDSCSRPTYWKMVQRPPVDSGIGTHHEL